MCPWNKFAAVAHEAELGAREALNLPPLEGLAMLDDAAFRSLFAGTAVKRTGRDRFVRNVMIAIGNSGKRALLDCVYQRLGDASPLVRAMAVWALARLADAAEISAAADAHIARERDPAVLDEWRQAMAARAP